MATAPQHTFQVLTKREERLAELAPRSRGQRMCGWASRSKIGASCIAPIDLRAVPAAVRFISAEPLLGPLDDLDLDGIHWLIAGGESGHKHRRVDTNWLRDLRDRCSKRTSPTSSSSGADARRRQAAVCRRPNLGRAARGAGWA